MRIFRSVAVAATAALLATPAAAQTSTAYYAHQRGMNERFRVDLGGFFQRFETTLSLSSSGGTAGTEINLEDFGQDSRKTTFAADGYWRFGRHGRLEFAYRGWSRSGSHPLTEDVVIGDTTYHVGTRLDTRMRTTVGELYYAYSFVNNGDLEFGLGLGVSAYFNAFDVSSGSAPGSAQSRDLVAPIPAIKAYFNYALYPRIFLKGSAKGISGTVSGYHGEMWDYRGGLDWFFSQNVGIGGSYQYTKIVFLHADTSADLAFTYTYRGPLAYVMIAF